jgi:hypothetical protein
MVESRGIQLRGYRRVFRIERRLFRFDRWRIPYPHGVPLRGIGYFLVLELGVFLMGRLPLLGVLIGLWSPVVSFLVLPLLGAYLLMQGRIDGRPPHHVLVSLVRWSLRPRWLAGLSPCPAPGERILPLEEVAIAYDGRESSPVKGRIRGPARVTFRYPAVVVVEGAPPWVRDPKKRAARARRYRVRRRTGSAPMMRGKVVKVPRGCEVVVE